MDTETERTERKVTQRFQRNRKIYEDIRGYEANRKNRDEMQMRTPRVRAKGVW